MSNGRQTTLSKLEIYIGLGSNVGDREANLNEAVQRIKSLGLRIGKVSSIHETEPVGVHDQPWFLNQVIETGFINELTLLDETKLCDDSADYGIQAEALLAKLLEVEQAMGRERTILNGPRLIDIDLLLFGDKVIGNPKEDDERSSRGRTEILVPHPRMHQRRFVLEPLCEIAPGLVHPVLMTTCRELLAKLDDDLLVRPYTR